MWYWHNHICAWNCSHVQFESHVKCLCRCARTEPSQYFVGTFDSEPWSDSISNADVRYDHAVSFVIERFQVENCVSHAASAKPFPLCPKRNRYKSMNVCLSWKSQPIAIKLVRLHNYSHRMMAISRRTHGSREYNTFNRKIVETAREEEKKNWKIVVNIIIIIDCAGDVLMHFHAIALWFFTCA